VSSALRVIAGEFGGRLLKTPRGQTTRPTSARVREALFSVLGNVRGARVLDLYAGSGALGIEALSRGAERLVSVEAERNAVACIRANLTALGLDSRASVLAQPVRRSLPLLVQHGPFDLVFCDPPWSDLPTVRADLARLVGGGIFAPEVRLVLEHAARDGEPELDGLIAYDRRRWGDTAVALFGGGEGLERVPGQKAES
jgi:16S rRNA (guanine(966)-N(2))-methyltransferase RsmD